MDSVLFNYIEYQIIIYDQHSIAFFSQMGIFQQRTSFRHFGKARYFFNYVVILPQSGFGRLCIDPSVVLQPQKNPRPVHRLQALLPLQKVSHTIQ
jgi:hypothetical protein